MPRLEEPLSLSRLTKICGVKRGLYTKEESMGSKQPTPTVRELIGDLAPKLAELSDDLLFGDIWERPGLCKRDRSLITVATLVALNRSEQLPFHLRRALENGVKKEEIIELITHLAFYSGWPTAMSAVLLAKDVFDVLQADE
jgi:4-carboxymuconolactone decarboxylase